MDLVDDDPPQGPQLVPHVAAREQDLERLWSGDEDVGRMAGELRERVDDARIQAEAFHPEGLPSTRSDKKVHLGGANRCSARALETLQARDNEDSPAKLALIENLHLTRHEPIEPVRAQLTSRA